jgi:anhydro-N-acetylmuramic acid kinase
MQQVSLPVNFKNMKNTYKVLGLMSGTSLDGLDLAFCVFTAHDKGWQYKIETATTIRYPAAWATKLRQAHHLAGEDLVALDFAYGNFIGKVCAEFLSAHRKKADFIASHGHTVFHQPSSGFTYQLGNGNAIHAQTGLPVVYDFRSLDVLLGGEGAPLVPAGDKILFADYDICLNLGGIANLSMDVKRERIAFDVCFCNMPLNYLMTGKRKAYDEGGALASTGEVNSPLLKKLTKVYDRLRTKRPSLGRELFEQHLQPLLDNKQLSLEDRLRTMVESTAQEIAGAIRAKKKPTVLCTGGGAFNRFLISRMLEHCADEASLILPEEDVIKFKEAMVFAFLGVLRVRDEVNCFKSVTGAAKNSSGGVLVGF